MIFPNMYEHFSNRFISIRCILGFRAKQKMGEKGMLDLATLELTCLGISALPFQFIGYVRPSPAYALRAPFGKERYA